MSKITKGVKVSYLDIAEEVIILSTDETSSFINLSEVVKIEVNNDLIDEKQYFRFMYENGTVEDYYVDEESNMNMLDYIVFTTILGMDIEDEEIEDELEIDIEGIKKEKKVANKNTTKTKKTTSKKTTKKVSKKITKKVNKK